MSWTSGETIVASRLEDKADRNIAGGYIGIDSYGLPGGINMCDFNILKICTSNNFTFTQNVTGVVTHNNSGGIITISTPADADDAVLLETDKAPLTGLPRILTFKVNNITISGAQTQAGFGLSNNATLAPGGATHFAAVMWDASDWSLYTNNNGANTQTIITPPTTNDVFNMYCTSARISVYKNNSHIVTHTADIPTGAMGRIISIVNTNGGGGNQIVMGFMS